MKKLQYHVNPTHVPGQPGFNPKKIPLTNDTEEVFKNIVPNDPNSPTTWLGKNQDEQVYQFSSSDDDATHFSGIDDVGEGVRNFIKYTKDRLDG